MNEIAEIWAKEYQGNSPTIVALRQDLSLADWRRQRAHAQFLLLANDLESTALPMTYWDRLTRSTYEFLHKHLSRVQYEFRKALQILRSVMPAGKAAEAPPQPVITQPKDQRVELLQIAEIQTNDGKVTVKLDKDQHYFLQPEVQALTSFVCRQYTFENNQVPDEYQHVFQHNGIRYEPTNAVWITYSAEEFWRICRLELETDNSCLLDGLRAGYAMFPESNAIESNAMEGETYDTNQEQEQETNHPARPVD